MKKTTLVALAGALAMAVSAHADMKKTQPSVKCTMANVYQNLPKANAVKENAVQPLLRKICRNLPKANVAKESAVHLNKFFEGALHPF